MEFITEYLTQLPRMLVILQLPHCVTAHLTKALSAISSPIFAMITLQFPHQHLVRGHG